PLGVLVLIAIWATTVFLYGGLPALVFRGQWSSLGAGIVIALGVSAMWAAGTLWPWLTTWLALGGAGIATGHLARTGKPVSVVFGVGALIVISATLLQIVPVYGVMAEIVRTRLDGIIEVLRMQLTSAGNSAAVVDESVVALNKIADTLVRLLPSGMAMAAVTQYALGFGVFSYVVVAPAGQRAVVPPFATWRAPFGLAVLVLMAAAGRFLGGETIKIIADNLLAMLALVYVVTGMSLVEHFMRRVRIGWFGRIAMYIMLFLAQILGFLVVALIGFGDSYFDWRARAERAVDAGN
ncbi:MAG: DUF2232 domain-containing protein, partial [candidate division Zixibacteria bacterium]|nr:DUF2232 domain-containing protein [candidate division Zixibacteria bacterium]